MNFRGKKVFLSGKYPAIYLDGKEVRIHRLVWEEVHGDIPSGYIIHHIDGNKWNWSIDNLEMMRQIEHIVHHKPHLLGNRPPKLNRFQVIYIRANYKRRDENFSCKALAEKFGVHYMTMFNVINGKTFRFVMG